MTALCDGRQNRETRNLVERFSIKIASFPYPQCINLFQWLDEKEKND